MVLSRASDASEARLLNIINHKMLCVHVQNYTTSCGLSNEGADRAMLRQSRAQMQQGSGNVFLDHLARDAQLPGNLDLAEATEAMQQKNPAALRGQFGDR